MSLGVPPRRGGGDVEGESLGRAGVLGDLGVKETVLVPDGLLTRGDGPRETDPPGRSDPGGVDAAWGAETGPGRQR
ncbi:hypothetical protein [Streptomyces shenzhenensis]|uniref:hypothetical protein n=1 Tax=Streptomyces shenzhenensis TaxID=943815 RepID=UPI0015F0CB2F|nr:hypothetical protein [Streptomyces shenzhenensis]